MSAQGGGVNPPLKKPHNFYTTQNQRKKSETFIVHLRARFHLSCHWSRNPSCNPRYAHFRSWTSWSLMPCKGVSRGLKFKKSLISPQWRKSKGGTFFDEVLFELPFGSVTLHAAQNIQIFRFSWPLVLTKGPKKAS